MIQWKYEAGMHFLNLYICNTQIITRVYAASTAEMEISVSPLSLLVLKQQPQILDAAMRNILRMLEIVQDEPEQNDHKLGVRPAPGQRQKRNRWFLKCSVPLTKGRKGWIFPYFLNACCWDWHVMNARKSNPIAFWLHHYTEWEYCINLWGIQKYIDLSKFCSCLYLQNYSIFLPRKPQSQDSY